MTPTETNEAVLHVSDVLMWLSFQLVLAAHVTAKMSSSRDTEEKYFLTSTGEKEPSPSLHDPSSRELSVVIPAYNEELRSESQDTDPFPLMFSLERTHPLVICIMNSILAMSVSRVLKCSHSL